MLRLSDTLSLKAGGGKSYKAPTLNDLYWPDVGWGIGNPDLDPETGYSWRARALPRGTTGSRPMSRRSRVT